MENKEITILGRPIALKARSKADMKVATIGDTLAFRFMDGEFHGVPLLFAEPKSTVPTPRILSVTASRLSEKFGMPVVYILPMCPAYERQRLVDKDVYFVVSDKYAHLPMLVANERVRKTPQAQKLTPVAQYLLLYHLQVESIGGLSAREIAERVPYSYSSVTLGLTCLEDVGLCRKETDESHRNMIMFELRGKELWEKAQPALTNPVEVRIYCDELVSAEDYPVCGINALSHYTMLNPDPERIIMMSTRQLRELKTSGRLIRANEYDGEILIEAWKYPAVAPKNKEQQYVDRLSLALSLKDDTDERVEGEVERLIKETIWKD